MADDASGPTAPKPADVAPQQAGRPDSPDRGKLRVFISYSRDDLKFADQLDAGLDLCNFECVIDRHGISGGEEWKRRLGNLISEADTVVFVLSPNSSRSEVCAWEVEQAVRLNKRILPVICRPLEGASPAGACQVSSDQSLERGHHLSRGRHRGFCRWHLPGAARHGESTG